MFNQEHQSYREFDTDYILNCCNNYLDYIKKTREELLEEEVQKIMKTKKFNWVSRKVEYYSREEANDILDAVDEWCIGGTKRQEIMLKYSYYEEQVKELITLCKGPKGKVFICSDMSFVLTYYEEKENEMGTD